MVESDSYGSDHFPIVFKNWRFASMCTTPLEFQSA